MKAGEGKKHMPPRHIVTEYYAGRKLVKITRSADPLRAIQNATAYLLCGKYEDADKNRLADVVQIVSDDGARVYSEMVVDKRGRLRTTLEYDPSDFVTPGTLHYFKKQQQQK